MAQRQAGLRNRGAIIIVVFALMSILSGCDTEKTRNLVDQRAGEAQQSLVEAREQQPNAKHYNPLVVTDKIWEGNAAMRMHRGLPLPARYETPRGITVISGQPLPLADIADAISAQTGIPVRVADAGAMRTKPSPPPPITAPNSVVPGGPAQQTSAFAGGAGATNNTNNANNAPVEGMLVSYEGPLSGLLERVAGFFGVNWRYDGTSIAIARFETRVFLIEALPGTATTSDSSQGSASTGGSSSGGSSGSSSSSNSSSASGGTITGSLTQNVNYSGTIKYWEELKETLTAMLGGVGTIIASPSNGEVTITTSPELMRTVADYLSQENKRLSRQIAINVSVYNVNLARDSDFNVDFNAAVGRIGNIINIKALNGASGPQSVGGLTGLGSMSVAIINPDHGGGRVNDIFTALSTVGDTTTIAQFPVTTVNNRPVSRFVGTTEYFVPQLQSNTLTGTSSSSSTTATAQPITSGLTLQMTPRLLDDGRIILQYSLNIQNITSIQCFNTCTGTSIACNSPSNTGNNSTSGCTLQEPITTNRSFIQQSVLRSGSTLIIGGVDEEDVGQNAQGVGDPFNWLLGGGTSNSTGRVMVFIAIAPQVLDPPSAEQGL